MKKFDQLGWVLAAALAGAMVGMGFQANTTKIGTVDMAKVFNESDFTKRQSEGLRNMGAARQGVLDYLNTYRAMRPEEAQRFRDLSLKQTTTPAERQALEKIKTDTQAEDQRFRGLQTKANPTPAEVQQLEEFNRRSQQTMALQQRWGREFEEEIQNQQGRLRAEALDRVRASVGDVARQQGFSVVFANEVAPYGANDLTADALKAMNARR